MPHVLVIEDDPWIAWMIADDLAERGYRVSRASNGLGALKQLQDARPDVIVLDLILPVMDGWTFVQRYQQVTGGAIIPTIVVSAAGAVPRSMEARGVECYLRKPIDIEELAACVDQHAPISTRRPHERLPGAAASKPDATASPSTGERVAEPAPLPRR